MNRLIAFIIEWITWTKCPVQSAGRVKGRATILITMISMAKPHGGICLRLNKILRVFFSRHFSQFSMFSDSKNGCDNRSCQQTCPCCIPEKTDQYQKYDSGACNPDKERHKSDKKPVPETASFGDVFNKLCFITIRVHQGFSLLFSISYLIAFGLSARHSHENLSAYFEKHEKDSQIFAGIQKTESKKRVNKASLSVSLLGLHKNLSQSITFLGSGGQIFMKTTADRVNVMDGG